MPALKMKQNTRDNSFEASWLSKKCPVDCIKHEGKRDQRRTKKRRVDKVEIESVEFEETSVLKLEDFKVNSVLSAGEKLFNINHIMEVIFSHVGIATLKTVRHISRNWMISGTLQIQKRVTLRVTTDSTKKKRDEIITEELDKALKSGSTWSSYARSNSYRVSKIFSTSTISPISSFKLVTKELMTFEAQNFLQSVGHHIKKLHLILVANAKTLKSFKQNSVVIGLKNILLTQVPNLEYLCTGFIFQGVGCDRMRKWENDPKTKFFDTDPVNPGQGQSQSDILLPELKILRIEQAFSKKIFTEIMDAAVNLSRLEIDTWHFSPFAEYFLVGNGKSRIHLLRHLTINMMRFNTVLLEQLVLQYRERIKLESISFEYCDLFNVEKSRECWPGMAFIISEILKSSQESLKNLSTFPLRFLAQFPYFKIPKLVNLTRIKFQALDHNSLAILEDEHFFPDDFHISVALPSLEEIMLDYDCYFNVKLCKRLSIFRPFPSIQRICCFRNMSAYGAAEASIYFPNALITIGPFEKN